MFSSLLHPPIPAFPEKGTQVVPRLEQNTIIYSKLQFKKKCFKPLHNVYPWEEKQKGPEFRKTLRSTSPVTFSVKMLCFVFFLNAVCCLKLLKLCSNKVRKNNW